jgi:hypothetical protein
MQGLDDKVVVPYIVYEGEQVRNERNIKRLVIALVITIMLLFATNALWLSAWLQYDYVGEETLETTKTKDVLVNADNGTANYVGHDGDIVNGKDHGNDDIQASSSAEEGR